MTRACKVALLAAMTTIVGVAAPGASWVRFS
jgi:hypothetical protein